MLEDRTLTQQGEKTDGRISLTFKTLSYIVHNIWLLLTRRWYRNGYACVNFGSPVSLRQWRADRQGSTESWEQEVEALADDMMERVGQVIPILPVALVATVFTRAIHQPVDTLTLKNQVFELIEQLEQAGRHVYIPRGDLDYSVDVGIRMLTLRHILNDQDGVLSVADDEHVLLNYYAASIAHLV